MRRLRVDKFRSGSMPLLSLAAAVMAACATEEPAPVSDAIQDIVGGVVTCSYPGVGKLSSATGICSATLVAPDMILTAAHCLGYGTADPAPAGATFQINNYGGACGASSTYAVARYASFGTQPGADDVAIAQLASPVPTAVATPMRFATSVPPLATGATIVGHGARAFGASPGQCVMTDLAKSTANFAVDATVTGNTKSFTNPYIGAVCPGDSGGPTFFNNNQIFWVSSAYTVSGTTVIVFYGEVWRLRASIDATMAAWTCAAGFYNNGQPVDQNDRYPFARVCGRDLINYECYHPARSWRAVGGSCGNTACQCAGGTALGGILIDPARTSCGSTVCGMDRFVYQCTASGWQWQPTACGS
jgi:hypothetical protein